MTWDATAEEYIFSYEAKLYSSLKNTKVFLDVRIDDELHPDLDGSLTDDKGEAVWRWTAPESTQGIIEADHAPRSGPDCYAHWTPH